MALTQTSRRYSANITAVTLLFFAVVQLGVLVTVLRVGDRGITVYNLAILPLSALVGLLFAPRLRVTRTAANYTVMSVLLVVLITILHLPDAPSKVIIAHLFVVGATIAAGTLGLRVPFRIIAVSLFLVGIVVGLLDTLALVGLIDTGNTAATVFPGTSYGGIGVQTSFGTHGTIVGIAIAAGVSMYTRIRGRMGLAVLGISGWLFVMLVFSQSRSSVVATVVGVAVVIAYTHRQLLSKSLVAVGALVALIGGGWFVALRTATVTARLDGILYALELVQANPVTGIGWDVYYPTYSDKVLHNTVLNYFVADGVLSGLLFGLIFLYPLFVFGRQLLRSDLDQLGPLFTAAGFYLIVAIEISFYKSTPSVHLFIFGALLCSVCRTSVES